jgi:hypothetical protein
MTTMKKGFKIPKWWRERIRKGVLKSLRHPSSLQKRWFNRKRNGFLEYQNKMKSQNDYADKVWEQKAMSI